MHTETKQVLAVSHYPLLHVWWIVVLQTLERKYLFKNTEGFDFRPISFLKLFFIAFGGFNFLILAIFSFHYFSLFLVFVLWCYFSNCISFLLLISRRTLCYTFLFSSSFLFVKFYFIFLFPTTLSLLILPLIFI